MGILALKQSGIGTLINGNKSYGIVTGTISGLRISNVAGAYFIDNCAALLPYSGCRVRFKDSGGKYFACTMGLRGVSEGFLNLITNGTFDVDGDYTGWDTHTNFVVAGGVATVTNNSGMMINNLGLTLGLKPLCLFYVNIDVNITAGSLSYYRPTYATSAPSYMTNSPNIYAYWRIDAAASTTATIDNVVCKQVLTPSNNGLLLQSAPTVDSGFLYNLASYTYEIWS